MNDRNVFVIHGDLWDHNGVCTNEVTQFRPLDNFWMGADHAGKTNHMIRQNFDEVQSLGSEGCWKLCSIIWPIIQSITPIFGNPNKNSRYQSSSEFPGW